MPGVSIGNGAIIAARAVVTRNVPDYTIVGDTPATPIRTRFNEEEIAKLLQLQWWDWSEDKIKRNLDLLCSKDILRLYSHHR